MKGSRYFFYIVLAVSLYFMFYLYSSFLMNLLIALLLCISTYSLKSWLDKVLKYNALSSLMSVVLLVVFVVLPLYFVITQTVHFASTLDFNTINTFLDTIKQKIIALVSYLPASTQHDIKSKLNEMLSSVSAKSILQYSFYLSAGFGKYSVSFVTNLACILIFLFFYFYYAVALSNFMLRILPIARDQLLEVFGEVSGVLRVVFYTSVVNIILQGSCFGILMQFMGLDGFVLGTLYGFCSIIPVVGGLVLYLPVCLYLWYLGEIKEAIFVFLYSVIFIGFVIDNMLKPFIIGIINRKLLGSKVVINDMLIFFAIIAGITTFGFFGIIVGPTITALFIALLRLYEHNTTNKGT